MPRSLAPAPLAATVAGLALLAVAGCSSSGSGQPAAASKPAGPAKGIQVPAKIASLKKISDTPKQEFKGSGIPGSVLKNLHSVFYQDSADGHRSVVVVGGAGLPIPTDGPSDKVQRLFSEWNMAVNGKPETSVATGSAGGSAECAKADADLWCGWVNGKVALTIDFSGFDQKHAQALVPQILTAMVRT
jgi:hypothetical protein